MNWKLVALGVVSLAILSALVMYVYGKTFGRGLIQGFANPGQEFNTFTMYYAEWCPHCQHVKPEFNEFSKQGHVDVNGIRCYIRMVEPEKNPEMVKDRNKVRGFPTFLLETVDGETVEYQGPRNTESWLKFINEKLGAK